jgi:hypothetical protein
MTLYSQKKLKLQQESYFFALKSAINEYLYLRFEKIEVSTHRQKFALMSAKY